MKYTHITYGERRKIERFLSLKNKSVRQIAKSLGRDHKSIKYEIETNSVSGKYRAQKAEHKVVIKRKASKIQCMRIAINKELKDYVIENIIKEQTPESISGRIKEVDKDIPYVSTKGIYKFIHSPHGRQIERYLYSKCVKKKGGPKRKQNKIATDGRITIDKRPKSVEKRREFGHFEGDFIESGKDGKGSLLVLVERKTRYPFVIYTEEKKTEHINNLIANTLINIPVKSITLDNDLSFQKHKELSKLLNSVVFFCHKYCSYEKGTVENRNKAIRRYIPKKTNLSSIDLSFIKEVENKLRNKYMKCLNYKTPQESWNIEIDKIKTKKTTFSGIIRDNKLLVESGGLQRCM